MGVDELDGKFQEISTEFVPKVIFAVKESGIPTICTVEISSQNPGIQEPKR